MSGYSGTPLVRKLGIAAGASVSFQSAPDGFTELLGELPAGAVVRKTIGGARDLIVSFVVRRRDLERRMERLGTAVFPAGSLWVAWPKRSSAIETDVTEDIVREVALPLGLVDNKVCAIDETWSGLRLVWRRELRDREPPTAPH